MALLVALETTPGTMSRTAGTGVRSGGSREAAPESVMARWVAGAGYAICVDFLDERQVRRWSDERKAAARRRNLERRVNRIAPLFADEFIEWELETRPEYFRGKSA